MRIQSLYLAESEALSYTIPHDQPATYFLVRGGNLIYIGASGNLLSRTYKHVSSGLIPRGEDRGSWMIYYWNIADRGLEKVYINRLRPVGNQGGRRSPVFHDIVDWVESACEAYFLKKCAFLVASLDPLTDIKTIWQRALAIEQDYLWLAEVFPWCEPTLAKWQRAVNAMQGMIARRSQPEDLIQVARNAVTPAPDKIPEVQQTPKPVRGTAIPKEAIASSIIG